MKNLKLIEQLTDIRLDGTWIEVTNNKYNYEILT